MSLTFDIRTTPFSRRESHGAILFLEPLDMTPEMDLRFIFPVAKRSCKIACQV